MGYKENQNLFVFPYDWRFGVSEQTATALAERIKGIAGNFKIDVIAHSTGGLLLKKALQQTQGSFIATTPTNL
jgi:esterase/lipase superfamily enzyme